MYQICKIVPSVDFKRCKLKVKGKVKMCVQTDRRQADGQTDRQSCSERAFNAANGTHNQERQLRSNIEIVRKQLSPLKERVYGSFRWYENVHNWYTSTGYLNMYIDEHPFLNIYCRPLQPLV